MRGDVTSLGVDVVVLDAEEGFVKVVKVLFLLSNGVFDVNLDDMVFEVKNSDPLLVSVRSLVFL